MKIFIKKLGSNESGYSGDVPNKRGKFILIRKGSYPMFPALSSSMLNDQAIMRFRLLSGEEIGANIVYHNAKFFPNSHQRNHDEVRLYRNNDLDRSLNLDRNVIMVIAQINNHLYGITSMQPNEEGYSKFERLIEADNAPDIFNSRDLVGFRKIKDIELLKENPFNDISNESEIVQAAIKRYIEARVQQPAAEGDPGAIFSSLINSQQKFMEFVRTAYDNKCALRGTSLVKNDPVGCEAAHVQFHTHGGPLLPTNGFLLSGDLHKCFDGGYMSLTDDGIVIVSDHVPIDSELHSYAGKIITPTTDWESFKPYKKYCTYHREHIYERFQS
tara:strand:- start:111 stop:1097 length:987 start_codon:yes stop_codon:yes gene_type:complete